MYLQVLLHGRPSTMPTFHTTPNPPLRCYLLCRLWILKPTSRASLRRHSTACHSKYCSTSLRSWLPTTSNLCVPHQVSHCHYARSRRVFGHDPSIVLAVSYVSPLSLSVSLSVCVCQSACLCYCLYLLWSLLCDPVYFCLRLSC
jgi:hypothetical protein